MPSTKWLPRELSDLLDTALDDLEWVEAQAKTGCRELSITFPGVKRATLCGLKRAI
jgi:hypothetical protein